MVLFTKWIFDKPKMASLQKSPFVSSIYLALKAGFRVTKPGDKCSVKRPCVFMIKIVFSWFLGKFMYEKCWETERGQNISNHLLPQSRSHTPAAIILCYLTSICCGRHLAPTVFQTSICLHHSLTLWAIAMHPEWLSVSACVCLFVSSL